MQASRLLSILLTLQSRGRSNARALAEALDVSVRTIHRDIDQLSAAGVPVYAERGRGGGFVLRDGYRVKVTDLTPREAQALMLLGSGPAARSLGVAQDAAAARLKLLASMPTDVAEGAVRVASRLHLDATNWYGEDDEPPGLPQLADAVWNDRVVRMHYRSWNKASTRDVEPLGLVLKGGAWYLMARASSRADGARRSRRGVRVYRVSSIVDLQVQAHRFKRPPTFDLASQWTDAARAFEARLLDATAELALSPDGLAWLAEVNPKAARAARQTQQHHRAEGWIRARIPIESSHFTVRQLLGLGSEVEVISPAWLRRAMADQARTIQTRHA